MNSRKEARTDSYGKQEATMIAGIAIILMFIHHFFGFEEYRFYGNGFYEPVKIGGISIERMLAAFGKLCVAIFAFNSGVAIWKKRNNYISPKALLVRASKFLLNYWIVMFLFMAYAIIAKEPAPDMRSLYCNLLGLNTGPEYEYVNVAFAWYVFFYIVLLAISPLLITIFNQTNRKVDILMFMAFSFIPELISNPLWNTIASTLPAAIAGILTAKWNLFSLAGNILRNCHSLLLCISLAIVAITRQTLILFNLTWGGNDAVFALLTILLLAGLTSRQKVSWIKKFLVFLGSYSMNLWFLHSIFFTGSRPLQSILYWPQLSVAILAWGLMFLLPAAILCSNVQHHLWTILKVAAKQHSAHRQ